ncbi:uncharacterized protein LOC117341998 isoform X2 [Pecten maximus]|uniref:uncharacterized protein LOC117341998 isoform X2 n=1 Tax=Pecten maximus TaxID=6579 RepID=UPI001458C281|nr:uncharacterized protein LOC117341998 isoform X2 [Pecten maximus]XP_033759831.1 uncharacterized protein LOC117341998 isoform X2 [Pecten maximus]XP_033759832.1 uncharacterized protein LOC117341998 isoform X2 [Pecten maximus]XP_033759833.1 uncharacterized protein LOC117341998 isoform X2 [Pecten maximus]XP_033759834.1 uncharacterized protein LOC117341998 isoform X2 [Pecten maximus]
MLLGRRRTARFCTYGGVLVTVFFLFILLQVLVSRDEDLNHFVSVGSSRTFASDAELSVLDYPAGDQRLINYVRDILIKPYHRTAPGEQYNFTENKPNSDYSRGQSKIIDEHLMKKNFGFYVDVGAGNGRKSICHLIFREREKL